jgi:hypothetical protein
MVTGLRGCATAGADSAEPTLPDSTAVLAVLPLNHRQRVAQHSVNRFDGSGARAARRARSGSGRDLCEKKPREEGGARFGGNVVKRRQGRCWRPGQVQLAGKCYLARPGVASYSLANPSVAAINLPDNALSPVSRQGIKPANLPLDPARRRHQVARKEKGPALFTHRASKQGISRWQDELRIGGSRSPFHRSPRQAVRVPAIDPAASKRKWPDTGGVILGHGAGASFYGSRCGIQSWCISQRARIGGERPPSPRMRPTRARQH